MPFRQLALPAGLLRSVQPPPEQPSQGDRRLRLLLPGGATASAAEVRAQLSLAEGFLWQGRADERGLADLPERTRGALLLVRHPAAGFLVRPWNAGDGEPPAWHLPPRAGAPLKLRIVDAWGRPASWAHLALWVDGIRPAPALAWLLDARTAADREGFWSGQNLPAEPVQGLAWAASALERAQSGALDLLAFKVPYPWGEVVEVPVVQ